jgi:hypothetical protein
MEYVKELPQHLSGGTEENTKSSTDTKDRQTKYRNVAAWTEAINAAHCCATFDVIQFLSSRVI